jgi:hypothetical protein
VNLAEKFQGIRIIPVSSLLTMDAERTPGNSCETLRPNLVSAGYAGAKRPIVNAIQCCSNLTQDIGIAAEVGEGKLTVQVGARLFESIGFA